MSDNLARKAESFGKRSEPRRVIIARGDRVSSFTISPWVMGLATGVGLLFAVCYIGATAYLVLRDDLIRASAEREAQLQLNYEDRIASLRAQIDRLTSRGLLDRRTIEEKVEDLMARQQGLDEIHARVAGLIEKAAATGIRVAVGGPLPEAKPELPELAFIDDNAEPAGGIGGTPEPIELAPALGLRGTKPAPAADVEGIEDGPVPHDDEQAAVDDFGDTNLFASVATSLEEMNAAAFTALDVIAVSAEKDIKTIKTVARDLGLRLAAAGKAGDVTAAGGPFIPIADGFDARYARAERALAELASLKTAAAEIPLARPISSAGVSSSYGPRLDPFLGRLAMHTGIDFRAPRGTKVRATAPGTVVTAGRNGGYGLMVEIRHSSGLSTRYGHLSRVLVSEGDVVERGDLIGLVGSTGRSTGPHLHYEVRTPERPLNPAKFVEAGTTLKPIIGR